MQSKEFIFVVYVYTKSGLTTLCWITNKDLIHGKTKFFLLKQSFSFLYFG